MGKQKKAKFQVYCQYENLMHRLCKLSTTVADVICLSKRVDVTVLFFSVLRDGMLA